MPLITFVLVVHGEQGYLEQCVRSILDRPETDVELLAIDDASRDHGPALLDRLAEADARMTVMHLEERAGPAGRNLGLEHARGDYVWFVDATDRLAPSALEIVAGELRSERPDVLLVHHAELQTVGRAKQGEHRRAIARAAEQGPGPLAERRVLAHAAPHAWNKILRRGLLEQSGARFGAGRHAELTVTWPALLAAGRIAALPVAAYERRRPANATPEPGSPFDVFEQYERVLAAAGEQARLVRPAMRRHLLGLLDRVPPDRRAEFFKRAFPDRSYASFRARRAAGRTRRAARRRAGRAKASLRRKGLERNYRTQLRRPLDPNLAVFGAYWYSAYSCNPRAIYEKARELVPDMRGVWVMKPNAAHLVPPGVEHVQPGTREYLETIARAKYLVNNVNFPNDFVKREGSVHVMTHHGTPLKKMGLDQQDSPLSKMDFELLAMRCRRWDYSVSANVFTTLQWERAFPFRYESLEVGYPRNDALANATDADVERARAGLGIAPDQIAVLYTPTHREYHTGYVPVLDVAAVAADLGPDYVVLSRPHYFYKAPGSRDARVRDVSDHPSIEQLCLAANVLVTDYSSIMFDYGVLDRPIVIHAPDWDTYRTVRGTYFDLMEQRPGPITRTEAEVADAIRAGDPAPDARAAFRAVFCNLDDGHAAERVVRRVWFGEPIEARRREPVVVG